MPSGFDLTRCMASKILSPIRGYVSIGIKSMPHSFLVWHQ